MANTSWTNPATGTTGNLTGTDVSGIDAAYIPGGGGGGDSPVNPPGGNSPIVIDLNGDGFRLTSRSAGVVFDLNNDGDANRIAWTAADSDDGFLVLDRNGNGTIDDGAELFGDRTPLHDGIYAEHGFEALHFFDQPDQGGNQDGYIDDADAIYTELRVWVDRNQNGLSEPEELFTLPEVGITRIALDYVESGRRDRYGNHFRFCAGTYREGEPPQGLGNRMACDVFFVGGEE